VKKLQAEDYIVFGGFKQDLTEVYNSAWLEVLTSQYEGFDMALLEAQEHGCPAVSYDINYGPNEIITNNYNGRLIQAGDETALVNTLDLHHAMIEEYLKNAYQSRQKYSFGNVANAWHNFLQLKEII
jgi:poly(glycerol-phosphate) alpha-glucosyltransferase